LSQLKWVAQICKAWRDQCIEIDYHDNAKTYITNHTNEVEDISNMRCEVKYQAIYSDGEIFERNNLSTEKALELHDMVGQVSDYFTNYHLT
jgi:hypothetical protein